MPTTLLHCLYDHARNFGDTIAFREVGEGGRTIPYAALFSAVQHAAARIQAQAQPGDVVLVCLPNRIECAVAILAALQAEAIAFPVSPTISPDELRRSAQVSGARIIVGTDSSFAALQASGLKRIQCETPATENDLAGPGPNAAAPPPDEHSGLMLLSSGTVSDPKIVWRTGPSLLSVAENTAIAVGIRRGDHILGMVPICHSYGVEHCLFAPLLAAATVHLCQGFDPHVAIDQLRAVPITVFPAVPSLFELLAARCDGSIAFPRLRCAYSAGAPLPSSVFDACRRNLGIRVGQLYGSSEVGSVTFNDPHKPGHDPTSVGIPMRGVTLRIVDTTSQAVESPLPPNSEGELAINAPSMLCSYVGESQPPFRNGFFLTGDLGKIDQKGALTITGRTNLMINVGSLKVNPLEIEHVLSECRGVAACVVVAVPVSETISRVRALILPLDRRDPPKIESIRSFLRSRLSPHKVPRIIEIVDTLPRTPSGKIMRRQVVSGAES
ncbi:MAG: acyl--CoA ligase [Phycisphaerae bacterium]|nr:acyl--CoA ligase [Phycisphaerae bacterium]